MKPTSTPTTLLAVIFSSISTMAAMGMTNSGTLAFSVAARVESTLCSAQVISENGSATLRMAITNRCPYMPIASRQRLAGDHHHRCQQQEPEQEPDGDQGERRQPGIDPDLDEQVAAAPEEAQQDEEEPVDPGAALVHAGVLVRRLHP